MARGVDLCQECNDFAAFLKKNHENICIVWINPLPLHSLSLRNMSVARKFFERLTQARKTGAALAMASIRGDGFRSAPCKEQVIQDKRLYNVEFDPGSG